MSTNSDGLFEKIENLVKENEAEKKEVLKLRQSIALEAFENDFADVKKIGDVVVYSRVIDDADIDVLRSMTDKFKRKV